MKTIKKINTLLLTTSIFFMSKINSFAGKIDTGEIKSGLKDITSSVNDFMPIVLIVYGIGAIISVCTVGYEIFDKSHQDESQEQMAKEKMRRLLKTIIFIPIALIIFFSVVNGIFGTDFKIRFK